LFRLLGVIVPVLYILFIEAVHANVIDAIWYLVPFVAV
jgi:cellulose synthase (UDP-forming)